MVEYHWSRECVILDVLQPYGSSRSVATIALISSVTDV
jgi:hypothetical protein